MLNDHSRKMFSNFLDKPLVNMFNTFIGIYTPLTACRPSKLAVSSCMESYASLKADDYLTSTK